MKVWYCEIHNQTATDFVGSRAVGCYSNVRLGDCRMVEMQLVPADARMVSGELQCPYCKFVYEATNV